MCRVLQHMKVAFVEHQFFSLVAVPLDHMGLGLLPGSKLGLDLLIWSIPYASPEILNWKRIITYTTFIESNMTAIPKCRGFRNLCNEREMKFFDFNSIFKEKRPMPLKSCVVSKSRHTVFGSWIQTSFFYRTQLLATYFSTSAKFSSNAYVPLQKLSWISKVACVELNWE